MMDRSMMRKHLWMSADGRVKHVTEIDDSHLENLIVWCDKRILWLDERVQRARESDICELLDMFATPSAMESYLEEYADSDEQLETWLEQQIEDRKSYFGEWSKIFSDEQARRSARECK